MLGIAAKGKDKETSVGGNPAHDDIMEKTFLTPRELQVFGCLGQGKTSKEIATVLGISLQTVRSHRKGICRKLRLHSSAELIRSAAIAAIRFHSASV